MQSGSGQAHRMAVSNSTLAKSSASTKACMTRMQVSSRSPRYSPIIVLFSPVLLAKNLATSSGDLPSMPCSCTGPWATSAGSAAGVSNKEIRKQANGMPSVFPLGSHHACFLTPLPQTIISTCADGQACSRVLLRGKCHCTQGSETQGNSAASSLVNEHATPACTSLQR